MGMQGSHTVFLVVMFYLRSGTPSHQHVLVSIACFYISGEFLPPTLCVETQVLCSSRKHFCIAEPQFCCSCGTSFCLKPIFRIASAARSGSAAPSSMEHLLTYKCLVLFTSFSSVPGQATPSLLPSPGGQIPAWWAHLKHIKQAACCPSQLSEDLMFLSLNDFSSKSNQNRCFIAKMFFPCNFASAFLHSWGCSLSRSAMNHWISSYNQAQFYFTYFLSALLLSLPLLRANWSPFSLLLLFLVSATSCAQHHHFLSSSYFSCSQPHFLPLLWHNWISSLQFYLPVTWKRQLLESTEATGTCGHGLLAHPMGMACGHGGCCQQGPAALTAQRSPWPCCWEGWGVAYANCDVIQFPFFYFDVCYYWCSFSSIAF